MVSKNASQNKQMVKPQAGQATQIQDHAWF